MFGDGGERVWIIALTCDDILGFDGVCVKPPMDAYSIISLGRREG